MRPEELERLERQLYLAAAGALDGERLRRQLREVTEQRLWERRGVELDGQPDAARAVLGDAVFELVREERREVPEPFGPGLLVTLVRKTIEACERLDD